MKVLAAMLAVYDKVIDFIEDRPQTSAAIFVLTFALSHWVR